MHIITQALYHSSPVDASLAAYSPLGVDVPICIVQSSHSLTPLMAIVMFLEHLEQLIRRYWPVHRLRELSCQEGAQDVLALDGASISILKSEKGKPLTITCDLSRRTSR